MSRFNRSNGGRNRSPRPNSARVGRSSKREGPFIRVSVRATEYSKRREASLAERCFRCSRTSNFFSTRNAIPERSSPRCTSMSAKAVGFPRLNPQGHRQTTRRNDGSLKSNSAPPAEDKFQSRPVTDLSHPIPLERLFIARKGHKGATLSRVLSFSASLTRPSLETTSDCIGRVCVPDGVFLLEGFLVDP